MEEAAEEARARRLLDVARRRYVKSLGTGRPPAPEAVDGQLTVVMLEHTGMEVVPDLSVFRRAQKLYLHENAVRAVQPQVNDSVEDVDLSHNRLAAVPRIGGRATLRLALAHNALRSCLFEADLPNLCVLDLSDQPGDVFADGFAESLARHAPALEVLLVDRVNAVDLSFARHPNLRALRARGNLVGQVCDVVPHLGPRLASLDLAGNPVARQRGLFEFVCQRCPLLRQFNGKEVTEQQAKFGALKAAKM